MKSAQSPESIEMLDSEATPSVVDHFAAVTAPIWPAWVLSAAACVWFAWHTLPTLYLAGWVAVAVSLIEGRIEKFGRYARAPKHQRARDEARWHARFFVLMMVYGTLQVLLIAPAVASAPVERAMLLTFMIVYSGSLVSSIMPLSSKNLRSYLVLTLSAVAAGWLARPDELGWAIAVGLVGCAAAFHKTGLARLATIEQTHRLGLQLAESNALLQQTNITRSRLTMEASHDLRQPVQALTLMAELLRASRDTPSFDARVRDIEICTASLADMLSELMEFSRLDLGGYTPQQQAVPVADVLNELNAVLASVAHNKRLHWHVSPLTVDVCSNPWMLRRILLNLATNAVKYTRSGSVWIDCRQVRSHLEIVVHDTGPGIPREQQKRIFMEFVRIDETRGGEPGMGIGLAFAKRAAEALGHKLTVRSTVGKGTEMILRVALATEQAAGTAREPQASPEDGTVSLAGLRMLVLENDPMLQRSMVNILKSWDVSVEAFASGENLKDSCVTHGAAPDVVVVDLHLDGHMNGLDAIRAIRERFAHLHLPAVLLTGDLSREIEQQAAAQQVSLAYKPLRPHRLKELLAQVSRSGSAAAG